MAMTPAHESNRDAWDERVREKELYAVPAREPDFENPLAVVDPCGWLGGDVTGRRLLCLAAGGGRHSVLFATAGAVVTVVDLSPKMLELDRMMAARRGLKIDIVQASMDDLSVLPGAHFEIVLQPVSTCYVPDIEKVYREVARVMVPGGIYVSQHKQPVSLQVDLAPTPRGYVISEPYHRSGPLPAVFDPDLKHREAGTVEFLHRFEPMLGGLCRAGFVIEDVMEPRHADPKAEPGSFKHRSHYFAPYLKIKARRTDQPADGTRPARLWLPGV
jgi:ubiquinone/menaquinone biosynthesis C-methylase UbiE